MSFNEKDLEYYKTLEGIKKVTRYKPHEGLHESVAGHCYMALMLAHDIMNKYDLGLNKDLVNELLLFHDLSEIGMKFDFAADETAKSKEMQCNKKQLETMKVNQFSEDYNRPEIRINFEKFEAKETREALFANLIDKLEAQIYILTNKCASFKKNEDYEFIIQYSDKYSQYFPQLNDLVGQVKAGLNALYDEFKKDRK